MDPDFIPFDFDYVLHVDKCLKWFDVKFLNNGIQSPDFIDFDLILFDKIWITLRKSKHFSKIWFNCNYNFNYKFYFKRILL